MNTMEYHDKISAYVDNELSREAEQEFLISLAANEGLRRAFRSELVMKNVLHQDEVLASPPRALRTAVLASVGLGAALTSSSALQTSKTASLSASGTVQHVSASFFKTLFANGLNSALTILTLSLSLAAGYTVHSVVSPNEEHTSKSAVHNSIGVPPSRIEVAKPQTVLSEPSATEVKPTASAVTHKVGVSHHSTLHHAASVQSAPQQVKSTESSTTGIGVASSDPIQNTKSVK